MTKGQRAPKGSRAAAEAGKAPPAAAKGSPTGRPLGTAGRTGGKAAKGRHRASTREGAHQAYAERDGAVERDHVTVDPDLLAGLEARSRGDGRDPGEDAEGAAEGRMGRGERRERDAGEARGPGDAAGAGRDGARREDEPGTGQDERDRLDREEATGRIRDDGFEGKHGAGREGSAGEGPGIDGTGRSGEPPDGRADGTRAFEDGRDEGPSPGAARRGADALARDWVEGERRERPGLSAEATEAAAQAYVEDPRKVARVRGTTSSFGTIGDTLEERMAFWDLVHDHESSAGGRTQNRLVLELPHEASAWMRHEIVRRYVREFEDKGLPYWATIHEPTKRNDSRNYHAHVVFSDRPMAMMDHPETGERVWDFTVEQEWRTRTSGNRRVSHPYRQDRDPEMRDRGWVKRSRARFAGIVNDVMVENGLGVRYDPRSYKDMGLDVAPMANVSRILADKSKTRSFVVMDAEWTRRMIDAEMAEAALRRDETYQRLREVERRIQEGARATKAARIANEMLPGGLRLSPGHRLAPWLAERLGAGLLEVERERLATTFVDEATGRALAHVIEATGGRKGRAMGPDAPDPGSLAELNRAAREEMAAFEAERDGRTRGFRLAGRAFMQAWAGMAGGAPTGRAPQGGEDDGARGTGRRVAKGAPTAGPDGDAPPPSGRARTRGAAAGPVEATGRTGRAGTASAPSVGTDPAGEDRRSGEVRRGGAPAAIDAVEPTPYRGAAAMEAAMAAAAAGYEGRPDAASTAAAARDMAARMRDIARAAMGKAAVQEGFRGPERVRPADSRTGADAGANTAAGPAPTRGDAPTGNAVGRTGAGATGKGAGGMRKARIESRLDPGPPVRKPDPARSGGKVRPIQGTLGLEPGGREDGTAAPAPAPIVATGGTKGGGPARGMEPMARTAGPDPVPQAPAQAAKGEAAPAAKAREDAGEEAAEARRKRRKAILAKRGRGPGL